MKKLSRRGLLKSAAGMAAASALAACQPKVVEKIIKESVEVEKIVKETVVVAGTPQVVEKEVTSVVEKVVTPTPIPAADLKGEVITVWKDSDWWLSVPGQAAIELFNAKYPNVELIGIGAGGDYPFVQKVSTMVAGGTPPELMGHTPGRIIALAPKGVFEELEPRIEVSAVMKRVWDQLPAKSEECKFLGKQVGLPRDQNITMWYYNKDLLDQEGVDYPAIDWSWDDMVAIGEAVTRPEDNQYLISPGTHSFQDASMWFWQAGGTVFSPDCAHINFDQEPNIQSMEFLVDLFVKYKVCPPREMQLDEIGISFETGKLAMESSSNGALMQQLGDKATWDFEWSATFAPTGPAAQAGFVKSNSWSIGKGAKNAELGWLVIEWWLDDEAQTAFAKGGEVVARNDIFQSVGLPNLPEHLHPALKRASTHGRALERCPGWSLCQKYWKEELDPAYLGRITAREAMMIAYEKAQPDLDQLMAELNL